MQSSGHDDLAVRACTDEQAFTELYNAYMDPIYAFVMKRIGHKETTEDLVSDIFRKVFLHLKNFNPEKASFRTWIYRVASNTIIDHYRSRENSQHATIPIEDAEDIRDTSETPHDLVLSDDQKRSVQELIGTLPEKYQTAVQLKYFSECSNQEIADVLQTSAGNVGVILHRAHQKLREHMIQSTI